MMINNKMRFFIISLFTISLHNVAFAKVEAVIGLPIENNPNLIAKAPTSNNSEIMISRDQYLLSYNKFTRNANWVAWKIESSQLGTSGRSNNFVQDLDLENYLAKSDTPNLHAVDQTEYRGSCFDRGHQIPSADRTDTAENNQTTFMMSNMAPQTPYLNRVIWAHLEQYTRDMVQKEGKVAYVITGPIYDQDFGKIGPNKDISVPSSEFKIIVFLNHNQNLQDISASTDMVSVIMPNTLQDGSAPVDRTELCKAPAVTPLDRNDWVKYKTTVNQIEKLSGLKFAMKGDLAE